MASLSSPARRKARRWRPTAVIGSLAGLGLLIAPAISAAANPPVAPHSILVFPQRDFVSASGYAADDVVTVTLIHSPAFAGVTFTTDPIVPQDDPKAAPGAPFAGIVEVNHPGGACWNVKTPDIRPGDRVRIDIVSGPNAGTWDETTVQNVTAHRPVQTAADTVQVHGIAVAEDGVSQIPLASLEQRMVANRDQFILNGRRTIRADAPPALADGDLSYDGPGSTNWTATYSGLDPADVTRALGAESRMLWLGTDPAAAVEGTIFEIGAAITAGPAAPCTAPLEALAPPPGSELTPPTDPTGLAANLNGTPNTVTLTWGDSTDNVGVTSYGIYRDGLPIANVQNPDASAPAPTTFVDKNVPPGTYTYTVDAADAVGNRSGQSGGATVTTTAQADPAPAVNEPPVGPVQIIGFPGRDFISSSGFEENDTVNVQVIRNGQIVSTSDGLAPQPDPRAAPGDPFAGIVEVNHPGGGCWEGVTPELRAGDKIRTIAFRPDGTVRTIDQTTVANVSAFRPVLVTADDPLTVENEGVVEVHGYAQKADGDPIPLSQLDQRLVANRDLFDLNGRRTVRGGIGGDGVTVYDTAGNPSGIKWTTTYSGLSGDDVYRAVGGTNPANGRKFAGAESRMLWLGSDPLALSELTIYENSDLTIPGPSAAVCASPLEAADTTAPSAPAVLATPDGAAKTVTLTWTAASDDWFVAGYRVLRDGVVVKNVGPSTLTWTDTGLSPGAHVYTVKAVDSASPRGAGPTIIEQIMAGFGEQYGNASVASDPANVTMPDVTPPSVPKNLVAQSDAGQVTLTWSASSDDVGVTGYGVYRDGTLITTVETGTTYVDSGLVPGSYAYTVDAVDAVNNHSAKTAPVTGDVTAVPDTLAPTAPSDVLASVPNVRARGISVTWSAAIDAVGVSGYHVYRNGALIATLNGTTLSLAETRPAGTYSYTVDAFDSAGNTSAQSAASTAVVANDPPIGPASIIAFPARDFISATGVPGDTYHFEIIRGGVTITSGAQQAAPDGLVEVNHPGGTCWNVNTPNIKTGDIVRLVDESTGVADQTIVMGVKAERPIAINATTIEIHGTAVDENGNRLPVDQIEQRLVANRDLFELNGRRTIRASAAGAAGGADGTLSYDSATSTHWTATYTGLSATDMVRATGGTINGTSFVGAESRGHWLGRAPLALAESTIFENGSGVAGGPAGAPCVAPAEPGDPAVSLTTQLLVFPSTEFVPVQTESAAQSVALSNGGTTTLNIDRIYLAGLNPGDFKILNTGTCGATLAPRTSCSVVVSFKPTAQGLRQAALEFLDDAANTTDQSVRLTGTGVDHTDPAVLLNPLSLSFLTVNGGATKDMLLTVTNSGTGNDLVFSANPAISGTNASDFSIVPGTGTTCVNGKHVIAGDRCFVTVRFAPGARTTRSATLVLSHNRLKTTAATSTSVALTGVGGNGSVLSFSSNPVNFGTVTRNTFKDQTISVKNGGNLATTLALASFTVVNTSTNANPGTWSVRSTTCATLNAGSSCNVVVRYTAANFANVSASANLSVTAANGLPTTVTTRLTATTK